MNRPMKLLIPFLWQRHLLQPLICPDSQLSGATPESVSAAMQRHVGADVSANASGNAAAATRATWQICRPNGQC